MILGYSGGPEKRGEYRIGSEGPALFSNFPRLKGVPPGRRVVIDVSGASLIDPGVPDCIDRFIQTCTAAEVGDPYSGI